jgi:hypothetical protein
MDKRVLRLEERSKIYKGLPELYQTKHRDISERLGDNEQALKEIVNLGGEDRVEM